MNLTTTTPAQTQLDLDELAISFRYSNGRQSPIRYYDDGFGKLWILRDTMGILGIVRTQTEQDAYDIAGDEFRAPIAPEDLPDAYGCFDALRAYLIGKGHENNYALREFATRYDSAYFEIVAAGDDYPELIEGYEYQSNATGTGIVTIDLNGEALDPLTPALLEELELEIVIDFHKKPRTKDTDATC